MHGRGAAFLIALALSGSVPAQLREFWAVDLLSGDLALVAGGGASSGVVSVPGWARQVRCDLSGRAVVVDVLVRGIHLVSATGSITTLSFAGDVLDAAPDGGGGAWVCTMD